MPLRLESGSRRSRIAAAEHYQIYDGIQGRRAKEWFEKEQAAEYEKKQRAEYEDKKAEFAQIEEPFKKECADFIAIGSLDPSKQEAAVRKMNRQHALKCDAAATELNKRSRALAAYIQRGRERALGIQ